MKYYGRTKVLVPWYDTDGMKQRTLLTITGTIDRRALIKGIIKFAKDNFKKTVSQTWVLKNCMIINEHEREGSKTLTMVTGGAAMNNFSPEIEAWIKRLEEYQEDADKDGGHPESESSDAVENSEVHLPNTTDESAAE